MTANLPEDVPGWAIRLEAKVDVVLAQHEADIKTLQRDLTAATSVHDKDVIRLEGEIKALDGRTDVLERTPFVTTKSMAGAITATIAAIGGVLLIVDRFVNYL